MSKRSGKRKAKRAAARPAGQPTATTPAAAAGDDTDDPGDDDRDSDDASEPSADARRVDASSSDESTAAANAQRGNASSGAPSTAANAPREASTSHDAKRRGASPSDDATATRDGASTSQDAKGGGASTSDKRGVASTSGDAKRDATAKRGSKSRAARGEKAATPAARPRSFGEGWNAFFFADRDLRLASVIRVGYAVLLLINLVCLAPDLKLWFSEDGLMPAATGEGIINEHALTLFSYLPHAPWVLWGAYGLLVTHAVLLLLGWHTRIQAIGVFVWLTSFQHRNYAIVDGEDTLFRMFAFYLALCPAGWAFSLDALRRKPEATPPAPWALRLFQIQISVIYLSSAIEKSLGTHWPSGRALYYIGRLDDAFGKWPMPSFPFESLALIKVMSWAVLLLEWTLPVFLWIKRTRMVALVVAIAFHLAVDYTMNLFLFHWIMILGLLSFAEYDQLARLRFWRRAD